MVADAPADTVSTARAAYAAGAEALGARAGVSRIAAAAERAMTGGDSASVDSTRTTINTGGGGGGCGAAGCIANSNLTITDNPVYSYRGLMVDSSRHFLSAKTLKHLINGRASLKLNVLHWHLIDMCRYGSRLHPGFCRVRVSPVAHHGYFVRFFRQEFTLEDAIGSTHLLRLKLLHACDQWHSSRMSAASHRCYCKLHLKAFTVQSAMFPQLVQTVQSGKSGYTDVDVFSGDAAAVAERLWTDPDVGTNATAAALNAEGRYHALSCHWSLWPTSGCRVCGTCTSSGRVRSRAAAWR